MKIYRIKCYYCNEWDWQTEMVLYWYCPECFAKEIDKLNKEKNERMDKR